MTDRDRPWRQRFHDLQAEHRKCADTWDRQRERMFRDLEQSRRAVQQVMDLHRPDRTESWCEDDGFCWPCPTVRRMTKVFDTTGRIRVGTSESERTIREQCASLVRKLDAAKRERV